MQDAENKKWLIRSPSCCRGQPLPGKETVLQTAARLGVRFPYSPGGCEVESASEPRLDSTRIENNLPERIGVRGRVTRRGSARARRGTRVLTRTTQRASRPKASAAVAAGREHRRGAKSDMLAGCPASRALETPQVVHADLVAGLLYVAGREVAGIASSNLRAATASPLAAPGSLLSLGCCCCFGLVDTRVST